MNDPDPTEFGHKDRLATLVACVGILFVAVLMAGMFIPGKGPREAGLQSAAHHDEILIVSAVKAFYDEYQKYPVDPDASGVVVFSSDNNQLFDVLRNRTGTATGNALNPRGSEILQVPFAFNQKQPAGGIEKSTGVWYDPWGTPYHVAINLNNDGGMNGREIPGFYSDAGSFHHLNVIVWSYGPNGRLGGGPAMKAGLSSEPGTAGKLYGSGDIVSW
jgi:hypothetical protein